MYFSVIARCKVFIETDFVEFYLILILFFFTVGSKDLTITFLTEKKSPTAIKNELSNTKKIISLNRSYYNHVTFVYCITYRNFRLFYYETDLKHYRITYNPVAFKFVSFIFHVFFYFFYFDFTVTMINVSSDFSFYYYCYMVNIIDSTRD